MEIIGYIGFAVLIFLAITWIIGVRVKLDVGVHTIVGAFFFLVAAIILGVSGANKLHSLWIIPAGFLFVLFSSSLAVRVPIVFKLFRLLASIFASIIRTGISAEKIKAVQDTAMKASINAWDLRMKKKDDT